MIILTEVAQKLENILNGVDSETSSLTNPAGFYFKVATEGFHIDSIAKVERDGNFIPVFISSMGGQFNPVKGLKQGTYSIPIVFYYPVRFKNEFFALGEFLVDAFVGTSLNYGTVSGKAISNISVPQYGEIQDLDFRQFNQWINNTYKTTIEKMEKYMSMQVTLYLTNSASGLVYGNDIKVSLSYSYNGVTRVLDDVDFDGGSLQSNSQSQSEQEEGTNEAQGFPFGTAYGAAIKIYPNLNVESTSQSAPGESYFYRPLLRAWLNGNIQEIEIDVTFTFTTETTITFTRTCFIQSVIAPIEKGQLFALTLSFAKLGE